MLSIVITAFKEEKTIGKAIEAILDQKIKEKYELIVSCPDEGTAKVVKKYKGVNLFKDPGKGKSFALNLLFKKLKGDILIFTDGDVFVGNNAINELVAKLKDKKVGCVSGRPVSLNERKSLMGYWSHFLMDVAAHKISRKKRYEKGMFIECSAYLFAFRNNIVKDIPLDVAEDAIIPYYFWKKGYRIGYAENALVYVKWPTSLKDWVKQKKRTAGAHATLKKYAPDHPDVKSFSGELFEGGVKGFFDIWGYPKNIKEIFWTLMLFPARLYVWFLVFLDSYFKKKHYQDGWERVESTK